MPSFINYDNVRYNAWRDGYKEGFVDGHKEAVKLSGKPHTMTGGVDKAAEGGDQTASYLYVETEKKQLFIPRNDAPPRFVDVYSIKDGDDGDEQMLSFNIIGNKRTLTKIVRMFTLFDYLSQAGWNRTVMINFLGNKARNFIETGPLFQGNFHNGAKKAAHTVGAGEHDYIMISENGFVSAPHPDFYNPNKLSHGFNDRGKRTEISY